MPETTKIASVTQEQAIHRVTNITNNVLCEKCGELLERNELLILRNRCLACYRKGVRFILMKLKKEAESHDEKMMEVKTTLDRTEKALDFIQKEYKLLNGKYQILLAETGHE